MKPLNLIVGLNLGLLLTGCPSGDDGDEGAGSGTADSSSGSQTSTTNPMTTTEGDTTATPEFTTTDPGTTTDEPGTTTDETTTEPGTTTDETTGEPVLGFEADVYPIIMANCSCHVMGMSGMLQMPDAATAYGNLVDVPSANPANGQDRIEPGDPEASFLWHKINGTLEAGEGAPMPFMNPPLPAGDIATFEGWILGGAQP